MSKKLPVKKGDHVLVIAGKDKGRKGKILRVLPAEQRVVVESVNMIHRHTKPRMRGQSGGILEREAPVHVSNVMHICNKCNQPTRIGRRILDDGEHVRYCKRCDEVFGD